MRPRHRRNLILVRRVLFSAIWALPYYCDTMACVTKLLEQAIAQVRELPEEQQDAVAANLINLISDRLTEDEERELTEGRHAYEPHPI